MRRICRVTGLRKNLTFALILSSLFANERGVIKLPFNWRNCNNQRERLAVGLDEDDMPELVEDLLTNILLLHHTHCTTILIEYAISFRFKAQLYYTVLTYFFYS